MSVLNTDAKACGFDSRFWHHPEMLEFGRQAKLKPWCESVGVRVPLSGPHVIVVEFGIHIRLRT